MCVEGRMEVSEQVFKVHTISQKYLKLFRTQDLPTPNVFSKRLSFLAPHPKIQHMVLHLYGVAFLNPKMQMTSEKLSHLFVTLFVPSKSFHRDVKDV